MVPVFPLVMIICTHESLEYSDKTKSNSIWIYVIVTTEYDNMYTIQIISWYLNISTEVNQYSNNSQCLFSLDEVSYLEQMKFFFLLLKILYFPINIDLTTSWALCILQFIFFRETSFIPRVFSGTPFDLRSFVCKLLFCKTWNLLVLE